MNERFTWELPAFLYLGGPVLVVLLGVQWLRLRGDLAGSRAVLLVVLRGGALLALLAVLARPVMVGAEAGGDRHDVVLLVDRSRSMGLQDEGEMRYRQALGWTQRLHPVFDAAGYRVKVQGFDLDASPLNMEQAMPAAPAGDGTDIGGALLQAVLGSDPPPFAAVVLSDGIASRADSNQSALLSLVETRTPVVAVGFGSDSGVASLSVGRLHAPARVPTRQTFRISAPVQTAGAVPSFDIHLLRNGASVQTRRVTAGEGAGPRPRVATESFEVTEPEDGVYEYAVQLRPGSDRVVCVNLKSTATVRVGKEKEFRVLYVQGALAWDFKFIGRALRADPTIRVTGLSRTSSQSVFRQNVETAGELASGFPKTLSELAPFRVLVLSELRAGDLSPAQQELVSRFCSELGGGVLMIGGQSSFDHSWRETGLERLLPVELDAPGVAGLDAPFRLELTDAAVRSAVFTVTDDGANARVWERLPAFSGYGRIRRERPGAVVWARHERDEGSAGRRVLVASHAYGAGVAAVVAVQNFWRWRLARDLDPAAFDRFWQQFLRFLGQSGSQEFDMQLADQELRAGAEVRALVERRPRPDGAEAGPAAGRIRVRAPSGDSILDQEAALTPLRPVEIAFRPPAAGLYTLSVESVEGGTLASYPIEIPSIDREMERTGRDMENLRQWAAATRGLAFPAEDAPAPDELLRRLRGNAAAWRAEPSRARAVGVNGAVLTFILGCLAGEWALRKRWRLR